jgi:hypothetical protein
MPGYISHIILLPHGAEWEWYEAVREYVEKYRVTITQSADDAGSFHGLSHTVTVVDVPGGWPGDIFAWLRQNYPEAKHDAVQVSTTEQLVEVLGERVETDDRYGERQEIRLSWPLQGEAIITQRFGAQPWVYRRWNFPGHEGIDFGVAEGTPVLTCADGTVYSVDTAHPHDPENHPYGNQIRIKHLVGPFIYRTVYAHLSEVQVRVGQRVSRGEQIGLSGATGNVTGPHLHLLLSKQGAQTPGYPAGYVDPEFYLIWPDGSRLRADVSRPHIYGVHEDHDAEMARMMRDQGVQGHILWTEEVGSDPANTGGGRDYAALATQYGHTAIVRLNHGYSPNGTLPHSSHYAQFARRCAIWVQRSAGCRVWIIGNEPNNPREHPPDQPITAQRFAQCFNQVYQAIKEVQADSIVVPGAIDPTNAAMGNCREYFLGALEQIEALDGFAVHAYTHGPNPAYIASDEKFQDEPLTWQYYHFRMFEPFLEAIPAPLRDLPVYLTETNHLFKAAKTDFGWLDQNQGWVWGMYQWVDDWNRRGKQQIHCALLYRYPPVDAWVIRGKGKVIEDFQQILALGYRLYVRPE